MMGYDFHRQKPLLKYIVDFYCDDLDLVIEIDGISHTGDEKLEHDSLRQSDLESLGLTIIRFSDIAVKENLDYVIENIRDSIKEHTPAKATPL